MRSMKNIMWLILLYHYLGNLKKLGQALFYSETNKNPIKEDFSQTFQSDEKVSTNP